MTTVSRGGFNALAERRSTRQKELGPRSLLEFDHQVWRFYGSVGNLLQWRLSWENFFGNCGQRLDESAKTFQLLLSSLSGGGQPKQVGKSGIRGSCCRYAGQQFRGNRNKGVRWSLWLCCRSVV